MTKLFNTTCVFQRALINDNIIVPKVSFSLYYETEFNFKELNFLLISIFKMTSDFLSIPN